ncbi:murein biosynthesis integral membrane protein MurJ [Leptospira alstonii]|uniref:Probable lipid II flippase MurJ n=2 Tax=Leptospira alstonii TaxID=28452 RepID=M6CRQ1_9LEPT|nr:murein biosynthesis integral membrane protein MurJ [Leptospira alstonii]EMJ93216.1 integral membrane protein MviN [Leptospira alstonii serovar Sichuan str. 79601]EQA78416.1 murein biosynthesis integral membrane protein MurJ [Leptospira alstonii serovar Pingchang str. 80-412]
MSNAASRSIALSFYTFLSRILGLIRDHFMAVSFGTGMIASAFSVAYRLPNMFRNLLAEGTLSQSFLPLYAESGKIGEEEAKVMSGAVLSFLFFVLSLLVGIVFLFAPLFLPVLVGGTKEYSDLVIELTYILFFLIVTASLSAIFMAISNSKNRFFVPSLSPIVLNLSYLFVFICLFPFVDDLHDRVILLCSAIVTGGFLQLAVQVWYVWKKKDMPKINWNWKHPSIRKIFKLMLPAALGGGFYQLSLLVDIFLANWVQNHNPGLGAVVSLDYSQRLVQLPTGIIGVALATTILPALLQSLKKEEWSAVSGELASAIEFALFLTIPAAIGMALLAGPILDSIYFGGKWDHLATHTATLPLIFYSLAIPFFSVNKILISSYYAFQDTKTPLRIQSVSFTINIILNLSLVWFLKHSAIALSSAISAMITFFLLGTLLKKHKIGFPWTELIKKISKMSVPFLLLGSYLFFHQLFLYSPLLNYLESIGIDYVQAARINLSVVILPAVLIFFVFSLVFRVDGIYLLVGKFRRKNRLA